MSRHGLDTAVERRDRLVHRCTCGAWLYGERPCITCATLEEIARLEASR